MRGKTILVTGGAGYIGSHTCRQLLRAGFDPVVYDNLSTGHRDAVLFGPLEEGDIRDGARLDAVMKAHGPQCVVHFAASAYAMESVEDPALYYSNNVLGSLSLLDAMRRNNVSRIVFSSSCATYGIPAELPVDETAPQKPISPYGFSKLAVEHMLRDYGVAYGVTSIALRYFNAAGSDPDGELGERHDPEPHVIPSCIRAAMGIDSSFEVFGDDFPTDDGSAVRDYIHVTDLATAHLRAVERLIAGHGGGAYNLATGKGTSVLEIIRAVERVTGRKVPWRVSPRRQGDPPALYASGETARIELSWNPAFSSLDDIVSTAYKWFLQHGVGRAWQSRKMAS